MTTLRSSAWFEGDDEVALIHRVAMRNVGIEIESSHGKPVIAIMNSASDLNPCNLPLDAYIDDIRAGVRDAGGVAVELPVMSLGEDLMKPSAMLYRNLLSMEVEEYVRTYPIDGLVLLGNCDKSVPGAVMGAISADVPFVLVTAGAKPVATFEGRPIGTGTDTWRAWEDHRAGRMSDERWKQYERCLACGLGACNTMGTTSTMAVLCEVLGVSLPGSASIPTGDPRRLDVARRLGSACRRAGASRAPARWTRSRPPASATPCGPCTRSADPPTRSSTSSPWQDEAVSTSPLTTWTISGRGVPVIADIEPSGRLLMQDFDAAGGVPALMRALDDVMEMDALTVTGRPWRAEAAATVVYGTAIVDPSEPLHARRLLPRRATATSPRAAPSSRSRPRRSDSCSTRGPAVVFHGYEDMRRRIDDPALDVTADSVLVLVNAGRSPCPECRSGE